MFRTTFPCVKAFWQRIGFSSERYRTLWQLCALYLAAGILLRIGFLAYSWRAGIGEARFLPLVFLVGECFDFTAAAALFWPTMLLLTFLPGKWRKARIWGKLSFVGVLLTIWGMIFLGIAECAFWEEFATRFNFIAVDYLIYTTEVLDNITQSYPIPALLGGSFLIALAATLCLRKFRRGATEVAGKGDRALFCCAWTFFAAVMLLLLNNRWRPVGADCIMKEAAGNGVFSFFAACRDNQLDYEGFYPRESIEKIGVALRQELGAENAVFLSEDPLDIRRHIIPPAGVTEKRWNVILIMEESLSAYFTYLSEDPKRHDNTPYLNALAKESLTFDRMFATGTRTVRGMEAVSLSMPPTPGQSIVRRRHNGGLFCLSTPFRDRGYDCTFLYGGYATFDNMSAFFSKNGYDILDRTSEYAKPQTFGTAWGQCDDDAFQWALAQADRSYVEQKPFHQFIMTTSNHRPYTFPEGRVDAPQHSRTSAVRYTDRALGDFIEEAKTRPWFRNTLFVVVADHCHSTSGRAELPLDKYHIPCLFYNPELVSPRVMDGVCSQIDVAPTLFGLLGWNYVSEFYGRDLLSDVQRPGRAYLGTFQTLAVLDGESGCLTSMSPKKAPQGILWTLTQPFEVQDQKADPQSDRAIAIYQSASMRFAQRLDLLFKKP